MATYDAYQLNLIAEILNNSFINKEEALKLLGIEESFDDECPEEMQEGLF